MDTNGSITTGMLDNTTSVDSYQVPVDPMDLLQCDSCQ